MTTALKARIVSGHWPQNAKSAAYSAADSAINKRKGKNEKEKDEVNYLSLLYRRIVKKKSVHLLKEY